MPIVENPDGALWIDIDDITEADALRSRLTALGVRVTVLVPDPTCNITVEEADWSELYPRIVSRNGPDPGIIVQPAEIPEDHTLLLALHTIVGISHGPRVVMVMSLIRGPVPPCFATIITRPLPPPSDSRLRPARPPRPRS